MTQSNCVDRHKTVRGHVPEDRCLHQGKGKGTVRPVTCHNINSRNLILCHYNFLFPILPASWRLLHTWFCSTAHANRLPHRPHSIKSTKTGVCFVLTFLFKQRRLNSFTKEGSNFTGMFFILCGKVIR